MTANKQFYNFEKIEERGQKIKTSNENVDTKK